MSNGDREGRADAAFERALLASAHADGPPEGATNDAWATFAGRAGAVAAVAAASMPPAAALRAARVAAVRWLFVGALGGGVLTATWLGVRHPTKVVPGPAPMGATAVSPQENIALPHDAATARPVVPAPVSSSASTARRPPRSPRVEELDKSVAPPLRSPSVGAAGPGHTLAAEVSVLDTARTSIAVGAPDSALRVIEQFHRDFPAGELTPDADVLAIEALASKGDRAEVKRAAERFLTRYPRDPHVARVRWLAEH